MLSNLFSKSSWQIRAKRARFKLRFAPLISLPTVSIVLFLLHSLLSKNNFKGQKRFLRCKKGRENCKKIKMYLYSLQKGYNRILEKVKARHRRSSSCILGIMEHDSFFSHVTVCENYLKKSPFMIHKKKNSAFIYDETFQS